MWERERERERERESKGKKEKKRLLEQEEESEIKTTIIIKSRGREQKKIQKTNYEMSVQCERTDPSLSKLLNAILISLFLLSFISTF